MGTPRLREIQSPAQGPHSTSAECPQGQKTGGHSGSQGGLWRAFGKEAAHKAHHCHHWRGNSVRQRGRDFRLLVAMIGQGFSGGFLGTRWRSPGDGVSPGLASRWHCSHSAGQVLGSNSPVDAPSIPMRIRSVLTSGEAGSCFLSARQNCPGHGRVVSFAFKCPNRAPALCSVPCVHHPGGRTSAQLRRC